MAELSMTAMNLAADLSKDLEALVNEHAERAQLLLPPTEVAFLLLKATANLGRGTMLYALHVKLDERTPDQICDFVQQAVNNLIASSRPRVLAKYAELSATDGSAA